MPCYNYLCSTCSVMQEQVLVSREHKDQVVCKVCGKKMKRLLPRGIHTRVGTSVDSKNSGKVIEEKNRQLKKKHAGYSYEEQNLRKEVTKLVEEKVKEGD